jgi:hypothetical protein
MSVPKDWTIKPVLENGTRKNAADEKTQASIQLIRAFTGAS